MMIHRRGRLKNRFLNAVRGTTRTSPRGMASTFGTGCGAQSSTPVEVWSGARSRRTPRVCTPGEMQTPED